MELPNCPIAALPTLLPQDVGQEGGQCPLMANPVALPHMLLQAGPLDRLLAQQAEHLGILLLSSRNGQQRELFCDLDFVISLLLH